MIKVGVIGSPSSVNRHISVLNKIQDVHVVGRVITEKDINGFYSVSSLSDYPEPEKMLDTLDALIITDTGNLFYKLATRALKKAKYLYVYPSIVHSVNESSQLVKLAHEASVIIKVGKIGKINARQIMDAVPDFREVRLIELQHHQNFTGNNPDNPIFEVLIANLEIIINLINARVISIKAKGFCMQSQQPEIINTRLEFDNGCAANITCDIIAASDEYQATLVLKNRIIKCNLLSGELTTWKVNPTRKITDEPVSVETVPIKKTDLLEEELRNFISCIQPALKYVPTTDMGFEPFALADRINEKIRKTLIQYA